MRAAAAVVLLSGPLAACRAPAPPPPPPPTVTVAAVIQRPVKEWDEFNGRVEAVEKVELRPRVGGQITRVAFREGAEVRKGDLLFVIDPRPFAAELARAEAQLAQARTRVELAQKEVARARTLVDVQAISREEFDARTSALAEAEAGVAAADAAVRSARLNLEFTQVRAPISGRVSRAEVTEGNLVTTQPTATLLTTVVSLDPVYVYFEGDEGTYLRYQALARAGRRPSSREARNPVELGLADETGTPRRGTMDFVDNALDPATGTIRARAVFANRDRALTPGLFARVRLIGSGTYDAVLVRDAAIGTDQDRKYVLVLGADGALAYRPVTLGRLVDGLRVVTSGLQAGEQVVVTGLARVRPGMKVTAQTTPMDSTAAPAASPAAAAAPQGAK